VAIRRKAPAKAKQARVALASLSEPELAKMVMVNSNCVGLARLQVTSA